MERWIACLQKFRFVSVRGIESQRILREHGLANVEVIGDPALFYCRNQIRRRTGSKRIGINLSAYSHFWSDSQATVVREIGKVILWSSQHNWKITLFPSMPEDEELSTSLIKTLDLHDVEVFREYRDIEKFLSEMEMQDIFIGVKLHTVIDTAGAIRPLPVVPTSNTRFSQPCPCFSGSAEIEQNRFRCWSAHTLPQRFAGRRTR
jgi:polysaccharide pyruvyl transferase WcaK-like protein